MCAGYRPIIDFPHNEQRSLIGINTSVVQKIEIVRVKKISSKLVKVSSGIFPLRSEKRRRCVACASKITEEGASKKQQNF